MMNARAYLVSSVVFAQSMRVLATLIIARFVLPEEFGAYAALLAASAIFTGFSDFAIPASYVQFRDVDEDVARDTALALGLCIYTLYALGLVVTGVMLASTLNDSRLPWIALIFAASAWFGFIYNLQLAVLNRRKQFGRESVQNVVFSLSQAATGVALAVAGSGIYAIVFQMLVGQLVGNAIIWSRAPLRWPKRLEWTLARRYMLTGVKVSGALYLLYVGNAIVSLVILRAASQATLGAWNRAVQVQGLFSQNLLVALDRVFFTTMCSAPDNQSRARMMAEAFGIYLLVACGFSAWFVTVAPDLVRVLLGPGWDAAVPFMRVLGLAIPAGAFYSIGHASAFSAGRPSASFIGLFISTVFLGAALLVPSLQTLTAIPWVYCGYRYLSCMLVFLIACKVIGPSLRDILPPLVLTTVQAVLTGYITQVVVKMVHSSVSSQHHVPGIAVSTICIAVGTAVAMVVYVALSYVLQRRLSRRIMALVRR